MSGGKGALPQSAAQLGSCSEHRLILSWRYKEQAEISFLT